MIAMKCPICGAPVPPSKGSRPRKFCSTKCALKAAAVYRKERGYKKPESKQVCALCGKTFMTNRPDWRRYCSRYCASLSRVPDGNAAKSHIERISRERDSKRRQAESCRETAPITVDCVRTTDGRTLVIETRGRCCVGWRSAGSVKHI